MIEFSRALYYSYSKIQTQKGNIYIKLFLGIWLSFLIKALMCIWCF